MKRFLVWLALALSVLGISPVFAADLTTNDILLLADDAKAAFMTGFNVGLPLLVLMLVMGWLLFGLRRGLRGRK